MKKIVYAILLTLWAVAGSAQQVVPALVAVPDSNKLVLHVYAKGFQVYRCTQNARDTSQYVWTFQEPRADLFDSATYTQKIGKHFLNTAKTPTWTLFADGSISAIKLQQVASPDSLSIPWLLLRVVAGSGSGRLANTTYVQRIYTHGGIPAVKARQSQMGKLLGVPYTAEYLFYK